jgi:hypothetical protein
MSTAWRADAVDVRARKERHFLVSFYSCPVQRINATFVRDTAVHWNKRKPNKHKPRRNRSPLVTLGMDARLAASGSHEV